MMSLSFLLYLFGLTTANIYEVSDDTLEQLANLHELTNNTNLTEEVTRETHPITNPNQFSHWTIGMLYRLPVHSQNCTYDITTTAVIPVTIRTSHLLGPRAEGFECWAVNSYEEKTVYFFGQKHREYEETPVRLNNTQCVWIISQMTDFEGNQLTQKRWDYYSTNKKTKAYYFWTGTSKSWETNFHVRRVNVTVSMDDFSTVEVSSTNFQNPCSFEQNFCLTGERQGAVVWGSGLLFAGKTQCRHRQYSGQSCLLSRHSLRCIESNIVIASLHEPYRCGRRSAFVRIVLTNNSFDPLLTESMDFVPSTADFNTLFNEVQTYRHENLQLLATQFSICENPNN
jgi:hypothetical protein